MKKPPVVKPSDEVIQIGRVFGTPVVVKGNTWLPLSEFVVWIFTTWIAGQRHPERSFLYHMRTGLITMPFILGFEWCHNFAHAATAYLVGKPVDAIRIAWGTPLLAYYDINDTSVTPRQHIIRAVGGPLFNALILPIAIFARSRTHPVHLAREITDISVGTNAFLLAVSLLPIPGIDGGAILKWGLVEHGSTTIEADESVRKVNGLMGVILGLASALAFKEKRGWIGTLLAIFASLALAIGSGLLREQ